MSYLNGKEVFPPTLLKEIQRYVQGACVYIPVEGNRIEGKLNGRRSPLQNRNLEIARKYAQGRSVSALAEEYFLSKQAIYKILSGLKK